MQRECKTSVQGALLWQTGGLPFALKSIMPPPLLPLSVAIACQGGGSHTAFTAGVLQALLAGIDPARHAIRGLSGTSGGALCAGLAWAGLVQGDPRDGGRRLDAFWHDLVARAPADLIANLGLVWLQRSRDWLTLPEVSPYSLPEFGRTFLAELIDEHIPFARLMPDVGPGTQRLLVGAVEVLSGQFTVFSSHAEDPALAVGRDALLASAAIPELFRATRIAGGVYWDGLFSQNPPIRGFVSGHPSAEAKPDEIWVIQINPEGRDQEPRSTADIADRRNELAGNLSLAQELFFVDQVNRWLAEGWLPASHFKPITVRRIELRLDLDYPSKLDRREEFIETLLAEGKSAGMAFLAGLPG